LNNKCVGTYVGNTGAYERTYTLEECQAACGPSSALEMFQQTNSPERQDPQNRPGFVYERQDVSNCIADGCPCQSWDKAGCHRGAFPAGIDKEKYVMNDNRTFVNRTGHVVLGSFNLTAFCPYGCEGGMQQDCNTAYGSKDNTSILLVSYTNEDCAEITGYEVKNTTLDDVFVDGGQAHFRCIDGQLELTKQGIECFPISDPGKFCSGIDTVQGLCKAPAGPPNYWDRYRCWNDTVVLSYWHDEFGQFGANVDDCQAVCGPNDGDFREGQVLSSDVVV